MMFIEVYDKKDRDTLVEMGYKLVSTRKFEDGAYKFVFANPKKQQMQFSNMKVNYTSQLHF